MAEKKLNFTTIVQTTKKIPTCEAFTVKNCSYVKWGEENNFPQYIWELYTNSSLMASIVDTMKDYVLGNGIETNYPMTVVNRKHETFETLIEKIVIDYILFGGFAIQVIRNKAGNIAEIYWLDFRYIRVDEDEEKVYYSKEWNKGRKTPVVYDAYEENTPNSVFYYKGRLSRSCYPQPDYISALKSLEISTQIPDYHLNNLLNGFNPSVLINFNNGSNLSEDVMDEIEERVQEKFCGTDNAGRILLSFNDDKEHSTEMERLPSDGLIDQYNSLAENVRTDILTAFRINKLLLGDGSESTGFNKQAYLESFALYNKTVIQPIQKEIEGVINNLFGEGSLHFDKFEIDWGKTGSDEDNSNIIE